MSGLLEAVEQCSDELRAACRVFAMTPVDVHIPAWLYRDLLIGRDDIRCNGTYVFKPFGRRWKPGRRCFQFSPMSMGRRGATYHRRRR